MKRERVYIIIGLKFTVYPNLAVRDYSVCISWSFNTMGGYFFVQKGKGGRPVTPQVRCTCPPILDYWEPSQDIKMCNRRILHSEPSFKLSTDPVTGVKSLLLRLRDALFKRVPVHLSIFVSTLILRPVDSRWGRNTLREIHWVLLFLEETHQRQGSPRRSTESHTNKDD